MCRPEATLFLVSYVIYCICMAFNAQFEAWATRCLPVPDSWRISGGDKGKILSVLCIKKYHTIKGMNLVGDSDAKDTKESETCITANGTTEIKLTPMVEEKVFKEEEYKDPLKKPLALDDGKWAVFCWYVYFLIFIIYLLCARYVMLPLTVISVITVPDCRRPQWSKWWVKTLL